MGKLIWRFPLKNEVLLKVPLMTRFDKIAKTTIHIIFLLIGNALCAEFFFHQSSLRYLALIGFLIICVEVFIVPFQVSRLFTNKNFSFFEIESKKHQNDEEIKKAEKIMAALLILIVAIHIYSFRSFKKDQKNELEVNGKETEAIVIDKQWESRGKGSWSKGYYIYYKFNYMNRSFEHSQIHDSININDTILIRFLPNNPNNHVILRKKR
eukprot:TRINITY_DN846_c0_g2_i1.p1 TRINITY_DN846_c0_g2~~TRINITY_DN846_c0_g2_i1.p1  ORF type:complete len:210 (-),score=1.06 TRINITY_DN846_c0_g2_i1:740-1369(-)